MKFAATHPTCRVAAARDVRTSLGAVVKQWSKDDKADEPVLAALASAVGCLYALELRPKTDRESLVDEAIRFVDDIRNQMPEAQTFQIEQIIQRLTSGTPRSNGDPVSLAVEVSSHSESNFFTSVTGNISDGGVFVATNKPMPIGTKLKLFVRMPTGNLEAHGNVAWVRTGTDSANQGMGVRLTDKQLSDHEPAMRVVAEREPIAI